MRIRDYNINIGILATGPLNAITDVAGVKVGHCTISHERAKTGVTAILPSTENIFRHKYVAAAHVINGFGKSTGLIQINELGTLESPIVLTNTFGVAKGIDGILTYMLKDNKEIGLETGTLNSVVCECNDGYLNNIRDRFVKEAHVLEAIDCAAESFEEGSVGAGTGMSCYHLKGGIGTSSRLVKVKDEVFTMGFLVLSNFGCMKDLTIDGKNIGRQIFDREAALKNGEDMQAIVEEEDKGSIIIIIATDAPFSSRQMERVIKRAQVGLARTGSYTSNGSGEVVIGFSTANTVEHFSEDATVDFKVINENCIDKFFYAVREGVEEAVINSMITAETTKGRDQNTRRSLKAYTDLL